MFIELVDVLRCTAPHADTYLVAAPLEMSGRYIVRGTLGCPLCRAEYQIAGGVAWFTRSGSRENAAQYAVSEYEALRCAALLDLQGSAGFAVLAGAWGSLAPALLGAAQVHLVLINPPATVQPAPGLSILMTGATIPLAAESARGVALDHATALSAGLEGPTRVVRSGGRLVTPLEVQLPANARLLASDDRHRVAEVSHVVTIPISIRRANKSD